MTLIFYAFKKPFDEPSISGFCQKLETFLRAVDYKDYEFKFTNPFSAPKGKLPYISLDGHTVADSHFIIRFLLEKEKVRNIDVNLTDAQRAESRAWQAYIEELVYPATLQTRISIPSNLEALRRETFNWLPWFVKLFVFRMVRRNISTALYGHGVGRHTEQEVYSILQDFVSNLIARLEASDGKFFHGAHPTIIDTIIYGFLANALATKSHPRYTSLILESAVLRTYIAQGTRLWFPEYEAILRMVD